MIALDVQPRVSRIDEPLTIRVTGLAAGQRVTLEAATRDGALLDWRSHAVFAARSDGSVDLTRDEPVEGYQGADATGLLWTLRPADPKTNVFFTKRRATPMKVTITATVESESPVNTEIERTFGSATVQGRPAGGELVGTLYHDGESGRVPAAVILAGSDGGQHDQAAALLASHGYAALALSYFGAEDLPPTLSHVDLAYFDEAIGWLLKQPEVDPARPLTVIGLSRGAELALQIASGDERVGVVVAGSPSSLRQAGLTKSYTDFSQPAWERAGEPLPFVKGSYNFGSFLAFMRSWLFARPMRQRGDFVKALRDKEAVAAATIEVERINGPVLLVCGGDDQLWPSDLYAGQVEQRLRANGHRHEVLLLAFPDAGHFVTFPYGLPSMPPMVTLSPMSRLTIDFGGTAVDNARAAEGSWKQLLEFLARHTAVRTRAGKSPL